MNVLITIFSGFVHSSLLLEDPLPTITERAGEVEEAVPHITGLPRCPSYCCWKTG